MGDTLRRPDLVQQSHFKQFILSWIPFSYHGEKNEQKTLVFTLTLGQNSQNLFLTLGGFFVFLSLTLKNAVPLWESMKVCFTEINLMN